MGGEKKELPIGAEEHLILVYYGMSVISDPDRSRDFVRKRLEGRLRDYYISRLFWMEDDLPKKELIEKAGEYTRLSRERLQEILY